MRNRIMAVLVPGAALFFGCVALQKQDSTSDDVAVYTVALQDLLKSGAGSSIVLNASSQPLLGRAGGDPGEEDWQWHGVDSYTARAYAEANAVSYPVTPVHLEGFTITQVADSVLVNMSANRDDFWAAFQARFPDADGLVSVTRVGYSSDGHVAVVAVNYGCPGRCGRGSLLVLRKVDGLWQIVGAPKRWVA